MRSSLLHNRKFLTGFIVVSALVLIAAGAGLWTAARPLLAPPTPTKPVFDSPGAGLLTPCLLYTSPSPRDRTRSRMPSSA